MKARTTSLLAAAAVIAASAALASCERETATRTENPTFDGDRAYCVVNINDVNSPSSTKASDGGWSAGTAEEHAINDIHFCFYDSDGYLVTEATLGALTGTDADAGSNVNVEFNSSTVVVLENLTHNTYPNYVVTVLNVPGASFTAPNSLDDFVELIASEGEEGIINDANGTGYFAMSTSSYGTDPYYFATPVTEDNFALEPIEYATDGVTPTNCIPIEIYVERLAAKVQVSVSSTLSTGATEINGVLAYQLDSIDLDGDGVAEQEIYVTLDGWAINATSRESFLMKEIDTSWSFTEWSTWNDPSNFRSYWGKSIAYGKGLGTGDFPTSSNGNTDYDETQVSTELSQYLKYTSLNEDNALEFGAYDYCAENTNTASASNGVIAAKTSSALTAVIVKATVIDGNGDGLDLVYHDGILYTPESYMNYALEHISQYWYRIPSLEGGVYDYYQISTDIIEFQNAYDGKVVIGVKEDVIDAEQGYYLFYTSADGENFTDSSLDALQASIGTFTATYGDDANYYTGGSMYYNVPIEHLNNTVDPEGTLLYEGNYGVVRNHWYVITINDISGLGRGIYNPAEVIVPLPEDPRYYIGADINILSWKVVEQGVTL